MTQIVVPLESWERAALRRLARMERREPEMQAAVLLRQALEEAGVLRTVPKLQPEGTNGQDGGKGGAA